MYLLLFRNIFFEGVLMSTLCFNPKCSNKTEFGYCKSTACILEHQYTLSVSARHLERLFEPTADNEDELSQNDIAFLVTKSELESSIRNALKQIYKDGYMQDMMFNCICRSVEQNLF